ncbi:MAG: PAS domain S-box protein [Xanthobacteraceae bacterium]|nr:MAG: PAS domain S-box protein [Xanthobacteraceae bacterium]
MPTNVEVTFDAADIIVSKTDLKGRITYANKVFCDVAGYTRDELVGQPHSIVRHPDMPRSVFKLLWDTIASGQEVFAYVKNMTRRGDFYWVFAHVTPSYDANKQLIGYHSNRRVPDRGVLERAIVPLYAQVLTEERRHANGKDELAHGFRFLTDFVSSKGMSYDELVFSL